MDRGSRMLTLFQTLEKLGGQRAGQHCSTDDLQQIRYCTSKILQFVSTQEKVYRDLVVNSASCIDQLLVVLNYAADATAELNVVNIFLEIIGRTSPSKRSSLLVSHGVTHALFHVLVYQSRTGGCAEDLLLNIHQLLAKVGPKDRKFGVKARLSQALGVTLGLLRTYIAQPRLLSPIVHVLKLYAANAVNATYLGKNGAVTILFRLISICGKKNLSLLKTTLDTLRLLAKSKSNSARSVGHGGVPVLLTMFYEWHKLDSKNKHLGLRKSILHVLRNLTNLKCGRRAFIDADGMRLLYVSCQQTLDHHHSSDHATDGIITVASAVMRKCFPRHRLPLASLRSPLTFAIPHSEFHVVDHGEGKDAQTLSLMSQLAISRGGDIENGYESSVDNDDDVSSDDDLQEKKVDSEDEDDELTREAPYKRGWEDLSQYRAFFPELYEFEESVTSEVNDLRRGSSTPCHHNNAYNQSSSSSSPSPAHTKCGLSSSSSLPSSLSSLLPSSPATTYRSQCHTVLPSLRLSKSGGRRGGPKLTRTVSNPRLRGLYLDSAGSGACAVNVKTGSSVFTLDGLTNGGTPPSPLPQTKGSRTPTLKISLDKVPRDWCVTNESPPPSSTSPPPASPKIDSGPEHFKASTTSGVGPEVFAELSARTVSVGHFEKIAYPEMFAGVPERRKEPLFDKDVSMQRLKLFEDIERFIHPEQLVDRVVYDLDTVIANHDLTRENSQHSNTDAERITKKESCDHLKFNSRFESGNLRKAVQIRKYEYDLILSPDMNVNHHHQWFYFEVSNMDAGVRYRFNIVNCEKVNSQFNFGMKPVMFSVAEASQGRSSHWTRVGSQICYYRNNVSRSSAATGGSKGKSYYTTSFSVTFKHRNDVCYLAYHYPYTYTMLQASIHHWQRSYAVNQIYLRHHTLCETLGGNPVPVLTITAQPSMSSSEDGGESAIQQLKNRQYIFLTARVHPGESNSSWVMAGTVDFLLSDKPAANALRQLYIFKIVPMLNPDGVINGNHRCSLVGEDLNRRWLHPCPTLHPSIYHCKGLLQYLYMINKTPMVFCDYHGHSRRKNVFLYGCSASQSWMHEVAGQSTAQKVHDSSYKLLAHILSHHAPAFSLSNCSFAVEQSKETTARVVVWRQLGVSCSYTMESSYCGCDRGAYKGMLLGIWELQQMGSKFCEALLRLRQKNSASIDLSNSTMTDSLPDLRTEEATNSSLHGSSSSSTDGEEEQSEADDDDENSDKESN